MAPTQVDVLVARDRVVPGIVEVVEDDVGVGDFDVGL